MSVVGRASRNHPHYSGVNREVDDRATTVEDFTAIAARLGPFTIDVAAAAHNTKCERFYDLAADGLAQSWAGERVWCNPPYSRLRPWIEKAWSEDRAEVVVMLIPANRTEQTWWQELVEPYRDKPGSPLTLELLPGRMRFLSPGQTTTSGGRPPFGCCLLIWRRLAPAPTGLDFAAAGLLTEQDR